MKQCAIQACAAGLPSSSVLCPGETVLDACFFESGNMYKNNYHLVQKLLAVIISSILVSVRGVSTITWPLIGKTPAYIMYQK